MSCEAPYVPVAIHRVALGPGSRCARPGRERAQSRRAKRSVGRAVFSRCQTAQSCSFASVRFFVPAPRLCVGVRLLSFASIPQRGGGGAPTGALFCYVARARRDDRVSETRAVPLHRDALSALRRGDFRPGARAPASGSGTGAGQRPARSQVYVPGGRGPGPPALRFAPRSRDATPRSIVRIVSGDAPSERGCESCSINSFRSQVNIFVS